MCVCVCVCVRERERERERERAEGTCTHLWCLLHFRYQQPKVLASCHVKKVLDGLGLFLVSFCVPEYQAVFQFVRFAERVHDRVGEVTPLGRWERGREGRGEVGGNEGEGEKKEDGECESGRKGRWRE